MGLTAAPITGKFSPKRIAIEVAMPSPLPSFEEFRALPHAVTLLGMSGVGKTMLSTSLRRSDNWFHYSADYRIGTAHLAESILDNIKFRIMQTDPFVAGLLSSDSIYIHHNISVDNLEPVSTYLGMFGDPESGGLDKATFLARQQGDDECDACQLARCCTAVLTCCDATSAASSPTLHRAAAARASGRRRRARRGAGGACRPCSRAAAPRPRSAARARGRCGGRR